MSSLSLGLGLTSIPVLANRVPTWLRLVRDAEAAAAAAGASLWYVPPEAYAARATYGPFVGSDGSGGNPTVGSGLGGWLRDAAGGVIGANLNGDPGFDNPGYWVPYGGAPAWVVSGGIAQISGTSASGRWLSKPNIITAGKTYMITGNATVTAGSFLPDIGGAPTDISTSGPFVRITTATITTFQLFARPSFVGSVDNVEVREIPGKHAIQATTGNKPVLVTAPGAAASALGFAALSFDGTNDRLNIGDPYQTTDTHTAIVAFNPTAAGVIALSAGYDAVNRVCQLRTTNGTGNARVEWYDGSNHNTFTSAEVVTNVPTVLSGMNSGGQVFGWLNGASMGAAITRTATVTTANASDIAWGVGQGAQYAGNVALACKAKSALTTAQRQAIERLGAYIVGATYTG